MNRLKHLNYDFWILLITILFADAVMAFVYFSYLPSPRFIVTGINLGLITLNQTIGSPFIFIVIALSLNIISIGQLISNRQRYKYFKDHTPPEVI